MSALPTSPHPEAFCEECGRANATWFAPSDLWNAVVRVSDRGDPMLCPMCFIVRAEAAGHAGAAWLVMPANPGWGPLARTDMLTTVSALAAQADGEIEAALELYGAAVGYLCAATPIGDAPERVTVARRYLLALIVAQSDQRERETLERAAKVVDDFDEDFAATGSDPQDLIAASIRALRSGPAKEETP